MVLTVGFRLSVSSLSDANQDQALWTVGPPPLHKFSPHVLGNNLSQRRPDRALKLLLPADSVPSVQMVQVPGPVSKLVGPARAFCFL